MENCLKKEKIAERWPLMFSSRAHQALFSPDIHVGNSVSQSMTVQEGHMIQLKNILDYSLAFSLCHW